jgi:hypothetical protein
MSIFPSWLEIDVGTGGVTVVDSLVVEVFDDTIDVAIESDIEVEIFDDSITVEIC